MASLHTTKEYFEFAESAKIPKAIRLFSATSSTDELHAGKYDKDLDLRVLTGASPPQELDPNVSYESQLEEQQYLQIGPSFEDFHDASNQFFPKPMMLRSREVYVKGSSSAESQLYVSTSDKATTMKLQDVLQHMKNSIAGASAKFDDQGNMVVYTDTSNVNKTNVADALKALKDDILGGAEGAYDTIQELNALMVAEDNALDETIQSIASALHGKIDTLPNVWGSILQTSEDGNTFSWSLDDVVLAANHAIAETTSLEAALVSIGDKILANVSSIEGNAAAIQAIQTGMTSEFIAASGFVVEDGAIVFDTNVASNSNYFQTAQNAMQADSALDDKLFQVEERLALIEEYVTVLNDSA